MGYVLGFDGGGTKTECVLMNSEEQVLARTYAGPSNPSRIGVENAARAIAECAQLALLEVGLTTDAISAIGAGLAGTAKPEMKEQMRAALQKCFPGAAITIMTDLEAALAAVGEADAIVLVVGTGSAAFGRNAAGEIARAGGYGPASSDEGSAYDIGKRAIAAAIEEEASGGRFRLGREILAQVGCADWAAVERTAQATPDAIYPRVFPVIAEAADSGNEGAREILRRAAQDVCGLVRAVAERLRLGAKEFLVVKMGGTIGRSRFFDEEIDSALKKVAPNARLGNVRISPAEAAALAAKVGNGE